MAREVDKRKTRKALRRLKRVADQVEQSAEGKDGKGLTAWEKDFVAGVSERLEKYGSAFRDPGKGSLEEALSQRQTQIVRVLDKKGRAKPRPVEAAADAVSRPEPRKSSSFKRKVPVRAYRSRDINDDVEAPPSPPEAPERPKPPAKPARPALRVIPGGKDG